MPHEDRYYEREAKEEKRQQEADREKESKISRYNHHTGRYCEGPWHRMTPKEAERAGKK